MRFALEWHLPIFHHDPPPFNCLDGAFSLAAFFSLEQLSTEDPHFQTFSFFC
jgi:hypothetical protein